MAGNIFGNLFKVVTFGESHGAALGCVVDGCPSGVVLNVDFIASELARRRPGGGGSSTTRVEADVPEILSGVFEGRTLGTPIAIIIRNTSAKSGDYDALKDVYRPGHADFGFDAKYGFRDHRGGGRSSGRETAARVAAGAVAKAFLEGAVQGDKMPHHVSIHAWCSQIAGVDAPGWGQAGFDLGAARENSLCMPCHKSAELAMQKIDALRVDGDSCGGIVSCRIEGLGAGLGEPVFDKLDALLAKAMLSIGAVKGFEIGEGFSAATLCGSQNNDVVGVCDQGALDRGVADKTVASEARRRLGSEGGLPPTNNCGGVLGGISTGMPVEFRVAFKPVPSISKPQQAFDTRLGLRTIEIGGRHDVCICPRAVPVVEAMSALVIADLILENRCARCGGYSAFHTPAG
ncbi:chorismate synthase [Spirochaetia bacterium]|nr:chorismate synthase [Spirochaetia bacterium]